MMKEIKLFIFDLRRGQCEGQELDKILFFFPADLSFSAQLSLIGLSEGLITFMRIFSPDAPCEMIDAKKHSHIFYQPEPNIWMLMVGEKNTQSEVSWRADALRSILHEVHSLFVMFNGPIRTLLEKQPNGALARALLFSFVMDYLNACEKPSPWDICCCGNDFFSGNTLSSFRNCLSERGTVPMMTIGREAALEVQSLVRVLESCAGDGSFSLVMFQNLLVSSSLSHVDTANLFTYAMLWLSPNALRHGTNSWSYLRRSNASNAEIVSMPPGSGFTPEHCYGVYDSSCGEGLTSKILRPLLRDKWTRDKDGFLVTDIWDSGSEAIGTTHTTPNIWIQQIEKRMHLFAYQHKNLTLILLVPLSPTSDVDHGFHRMHIMKVFENALLKILKVEEKLSKGWGGENAYHASGYRYLLLDRDRNVSRASPPKKVATLTKESLAVLSKVRDEVDSEKNRSVDGVRKMKELEVCVRARNSCWVIAHLHREKEIYMALDKAGDTLLLASDAFDKFSDRYCEGSFSY